MYNFPCSTLPRLCFVLIQRIDQRPRIVLGRYLWGHIGKNNCGVYGIRIIKIKIDIINRITPPNLFGIKIECQD